MVIYTRACVWTTKRMCTDNTYTDNLEQILTEDQLEHEMIQDDWTENSAAKNEITYGTIREIYEFGGNCRSAYGIAVYSSAESGGIVSVILSFHDVSADKERVDKLVWLCNQLALAPVHLAEVIEDFMAL